MPVGARSKRVITWCVEVVQRQARPGGARSRPRLPVARVLQTPGAVTDSARMELNELRWYDMLVFGGVAIGVLIVLARLLLRL